MQLLDIAKLPTAENSAIHLHHSDNVAIARVPLSTGSELNIEGHAVSVQDSVPAGHKIAIERIPAGEVIHRYGQAIGRAKNDIAPGQHVHVHNVSFEELHFAYEYPERETPLPQTPADAPHFMGYLREDGRAGTRNYIAVVAASNCAAHTAELIAASFRRHEAAGEHRWRRGIPAWGRLRYVDRTRHGPVAAHPCRRSRASERRGGGDPRPRLRSEPDRPLPRTKRAAQHSSGRHDVAGKRRHARRRSKRRGDRSSR